MSFRVAGLVCLAMLGQCKKPQPPKAAPPEAAQPAPAAHPPGDTAAPLSTPASDLQGPAISSPPPGAEATSEAWLTLGRQQLAAAQKPVSAQARARNVILFIGNGMGLSTVTAARILDGQTHGQTGEENVLSFETFPATALAKTYNTDLQVAESAGSMSAIMTGVKTRGASVAMDAGPERGQCKEAAGHQTITLLEQAKDAGMAAGLVTTARVTLAVPAAAYAHVTDRDWEVDARMPAQAIEEKCQDIASQLVGFDHHGGLDVVLGGGRLAFMTPDQIDPGDSPYHGVRRTIGDGGVDLIAVWRARNPHGVYVTTASALAQTAGVAGPILGLFAPDNMSHEWDRTHPVQLPNAAREEPSLTDMTKAAIDRLSHGKKGYVLVVDADGIDTAHHDGNAYRALTDTIEFSRAVDAAAAATSRTDDTLIIVTATQGHTLAISGYPKRGAPILGLASGPGADSPYPTLSYANGPGQALAKAEVKQGAKAGPSALPVSTGVRSKDHFTSILTDAETGDPDYLQPAAVSMSAETHSGEDVPVYARGPGAQSVHGTLEQNLLYWVMHTALWPSGDLPNTP